MATRVYVAIASTSQTGNQVFDDSGYTYQATFASLAAVFADATYGFRDITVANTDEELFFDVFNSYTETNGSDCDTRQFTTSITNQIIIRSAPGYEHAGKPLTGVKITWVEGYADKYYIGEFITMQDLVLELKGDQSIQLFVEGTIKRLVTNIFTRFTGYLGIYLEGTGTAISCIQYDDAGGENGFRGGNYSDYSLFNCVAITNSGLGNGFSFPASYGQGVVTVKNCLAIGFATDFNNTSYSNLTMENCGSSDATAIGIGALTNLVAADEFEDYLNWDMHLSAGNSIASSGQDLVLAGDLTADDWRDIDGQPYAGFPMGADEPSAFTVPVTITIKDATTLLPVQNVDVYLKADTGGPAVVGTEIMSGTTDVNGEAYFDTPFSSIQPILGQGRKGTASPFYQETKFSGVMTGDGYTNTAYIISDED